LSDASLPLVTVVMPIRNEADAIGRSLAAVLSQDYPHDLLEVIVADGRSTDRTLEMVETFLARDPRVRLCDNPGRIVPTGLNTAIALARGEIVVRVDGHCEIAPDYVRRCIGHLRRGEADGVGGSIETIGATPSSRAIALAMSSRFGVGNSAFRTERAATRLVDTVPFPAYTREILRRAGPFDEELVRNQDDEYNFRVRELGGRILLASDVRSRYESRGSLRSLARQYFQYGYWKVRVMQKHPRQMSARHFVPAAFVSALVASGLAALAIPGARTAFIGLAAIYAAAYLLVSAVVLRRAGSGPLLLLPVAFATLHLAYGAGFLFGLLRFAGRWGDRGASSQAGAGSPEA
jgi:glycosyltransferase involved in cell wall biosynthesis